MRILLVTSEITYIPQNCQSFFETVLRESSQHIAGLVLLKNLSLDLIFKIPWLYSNGCVNFSNTLVFNSLSLFFDKRVRLFKKYGLPVVKVKDINENTLVNWVKENKIDLIVNFRTRNKFKKEILSASRFGCVNIHHGLLPKYRGIFGDLYALSEKRPAGITIHKMSEKIDDGSILLKEKISSGDERNYLIYLSKIYKKESALLIQLINRLVEQGFLPKGERNYCKNPVYTSTPTTEKINKMRQSGLIL